MKKLIISLSVIAVTFLVPASVLAQEDETCVTVYGGGVVCGAKTHEPVDTALGDINPGILGGALLLTSYGLYRLSKRSNSFELTK